VSTVLEKGYQVLCLDQRGTGLSTPITASTLGLRGDDDVQAQYLRSFRADSIVKDCEAVRKALTADLPEEKRKWSIMGQSFGGYCCTTYLSFYPESVREAFVFGGLPPLVEGPDEVYRRLFKKVEQRNEAYYAKYPEDVERVQHILRFLQRFGDTTVQDMTQEGFLTARRFLQLGLQFGFHGGLDTIHELVLRATNDLTLFGHITRPTVARITGALPFEDAIIYAVLHEPLYCQGTASNWSAHRIRESMGPEFQIAKDGGVGTEKPVYFTGEMIFPWMFEDYGELKRIAIQAEKVQQFDDWPAVYDVQQLQKNEVPVYAAVYIDDMYVDFNYSMEAASAIRGCKTYVTNAMYHDAVRSRMDEVTKALFTLRDDSID
jgi:pimeloyl-ACP methyl ester carboxylesterase